MDEEEKKLKEEYMEIDLDEKGIKQYMMGYEKANQKFNKKLKDDQLKDYIDGYKSGFKDGYKAAMEELIKEVGSQAMFEGEGQPGWPWPKIP